MNITTEFPDFDNLDAFNVILKALAPIGFVDASWSNDGCPSIVLSHPNGESIHTIWVDYADPSKREYENSSIFAVTSYDNTIDTVSSDDLDRFLGDVKIHLVADLADFYTAELVDKLDPPERDAVRENRAVPCDFYDANESMISAWEESFGRTPFDAEGHLPEITLDIINAASPIAHSKV